MAPINWQPFSRVLWIVLAGSIELGGLTSVARASSDVDPPHEDDTEEYSDELDATGDANDGEPAL